MSIPGELNPSQRVLMGPGPSDAHPRVLRAMATPLIGHLDPDFLKIMDECKDMLRQVFQTENEMTFAISAPGSAGMEACFVNLLEPGDKVLVMVNGVFGMRMCENAERCGAELKRVDIPWGQPVTPDDIKKGLEGFDAKVVALVHAETSTGVLSPVEEIGTLVKDAGALLVVDAVTSLAGVPLKVDAWNIDAIYSGTQKCLSAPPGISPVSFSNAALAAIDARSTKIQSWFLDLTLVRNYVSGAQRAYHHTAPVSSIYALRESLRIVLEEGLEARFARHRANHELLREGLESLGFEFIVAPEYRLPQLNAVKIPEGHDDKAVRGKLLNDYNIEIGAGLGDFAGKVWRIGLMGESSTPNHVNMLLSALREIMK